MTAIQLFTGQESGEGEEITVLAPGSLEAASFSVLATLPGLPCGDLFSFPPLPPFRCLSPSFLPVFVPLPLACSLKLACGTQGQTDYSFSSMNVPSN